MRLGIVSLGSLSSQWIAKEAANYFDKVEELDLKKFEVNMSDAGAEVSYDGKPLGKYDCLYVRGSHKYSMLQRAITRALHHEVYMPTDPKAFTIAHDKFLTLIELQKHKVAIPRSFYAPDTNAAKKLLEEITYPVIIKLPSGTHGKGVTIADSIESAKTFIDALQTFKSPYILQEFIDTGAKDIRAIVAGDKVIAGMNRVAAKKEIRANIHSGGKGLKIEIDAEVERLAVLSAKAVGADVCAVDILKGRKPVVLEVNLSPGLQGITKVTGINVAREIARFLHESTMEFMEKQAKTGFTGIKKELDIEHKDEHEKEMMTSLDVRTGIIRLPKVITDITKFNSDTEVKITAKKGKVTIEKYKIS
ncbi:MAG TPA: RimK family alpha-L-glutamate ligase [Candidatus Nanoarchaeia archaeon]|nr:RimK family alpha-L-glutamate ligase [Candidatus Nanoarchaeia archaeon]